MSKSNPSHLAALLEGALGAQRREWLLRAIALPVGLEGSAGAGEPGARVSRAELAAALAMLLFDDICGRVPLAAAYAEEAIQSGQPLVFDHGAMRTVAAPSGALPAGRAAIERVLVPLGYRQREIYPLKRIGMTGYSYASEDLPEGLPQFFVSELHPERFSSAFQAATARVIGTSVDPLGEWALALLGELEESGGLDLPDARQLLPSLAACFQRQHDLPALADYELLLVESAEMAWIATEGHAFNHATDRVADVEAVAAAQRALGRPIKDSLEVSGSGRVVQTAFRAAQVERLFRGPDGRLVTRSVPGSFHEFITRRQLPGTNDLDLAFDASNAQGIFRMTSPKSAS